MGRADDRLRGGDPMLRGSVIAAVVVAPTLNYHYYPAFVDMKKAVKDYHPGASPLSRVPDGKRSYSASGTYGDATLATREKGRQIVEAMVERLLKEIAELRKAALKPEKR
jgi:creatinine amidohydrolase/Fe(II)-dependent formamide hydrolase-like protein